MAEAWGKTPSQVLDEWQCTKGGTRLASALKLLRHRYRGDGLDRIQNVGFLAAHFVRKE